MEDEVSLRELLEVLLRRKWMIAGVTVVAMLAAAVLSWWVFSPVYEAKVTMMVTLPPKAKVSDGGSTVETLLEAMSAAPELSLEACRVQIKNPAVLQKALQATGENMTPGQLAGAVNARLIKDTNLIQVLVEDRDPLRAARLADAVVGQYISHMNDINADRSGRAATLLREQMVHEEQAMGEAMDEWKRFLQTPRGVDELQAEVQARITSLTDYKVQAESLRVQIGATAAALQAAEDAAVRLSPVISTRRALVEDDAMRELLATLSGDRAAALRSLSLNSEEVNLAYVEAVKQANELRVQLASLNSQLAGVQQAISGTQRQLEALRVELAEKQLAQDRVQTKLQTVKDSYLGFAKKYEEMRVAESGRLAATTIQVVAGAAVPEEPVRPRKALNVAVAGVLGLMIGVFAAFFADYWQRSSPAGVQHSG